MNKCIAGILFALACWAQPPVLTPDQMQAALSHDLRGLPFSDAASGILAADPRARPAGEVVSVSQVQHHPPKEARRALARADKLRRAARHAEAIAELESAVRIDPAFGDAHQWLGFEYAQIGRLTDAAASFRRVLELQPDDWRGHYNLGLALLQSGLYANAEISARRALQLAPTDPSVNLLFGCVLSVSPDRRKEARSYFEFAARKLPEARQFLSQIENR